jgi:tripartite-type tricarboxylate transporter receptor subunit TctC
MKRHAAGLIALLALAILSLAANPLYAQTWPQRPIIIIVPFPAGGGTDAFARPLAAQLDAQLGTRVLIENRGGAGGTLGASVAARANPDGYTFFIGGAHHAIAPSLYPKLDYSIEKDFVPIGMIARPPQVIVVNPGKVAAKTLAELVEHARANPEKLTYASAGVGTTHHLAGELFKMLTNTRILHVPYRGAGPAVADLVAGHVDLMFDGLGSSAPQIQGGHFRALAVAASKRAAAFPGIPTAAEAGLQGYDVATWYAMWAPRNTPPEIVERMRREVHTALGMAAIKSAWEQNGSEVPSLIGEEFGKFLAAEVVRWSNVVQDAGIKLE